MGVGIKTRDPRGSVRGRGLGTESGRFLEPSSKRFVRSRPKFRTETTNELDTGTR